MNGDEDRGKRFLREMKCAGRHSEDVAPPIPLMDSIRDQ